MNRVVEATEDSSAAKITAYYASNGAANGSDGVAAAAGIADVVRELPVNGARMGEEWVKPAGAVVYWRNAEMADSCQSYADDIVPEFSGRCLF